MALNAEETWLLINVETRPSIAVETWPSLGRDFWNVKIALDALRRERRRRLGRVSGSD